MGVEGSLLPVIFQIFFLFYFVQYLMEPTGLGVKDIGRSGSKEAGSGKFYTHYTYI